MKGGKGIIKPEGYDYTSGWRWKRGSCGIVVVGGRSYAMGREWLRNQVVSQWA